MFNYLKFICFIINLTKTLDKISAYKPIISDSDLEKSIIYIKNGSNYFSFEIIATNKDVMKKI